MRVFQELWVSGPLLTESYQEALIMAVQYTDKELRCTDCSTDFTFSAGEQEHHAQLGFTNEPKRCKPCRAERKRDRGEGGGFPGGGRELHDVICADCGSNAKVPFKPTLNKDPTEPLLAHYLFD